MSWHASHQSLLIPSHQSLLLPLHQSPLDFLHIEDGKEGRSIDVVNDLFQLGDLQTTHDAVEDILVILQEAPLSVQTGDSAMHIMNDRI